MNLTANDSAQYGSRLAALSMHDPHSSALVVHLIKVLNRLDVELFEIRNGWKPFRSTRNLEITFRFVSENISQSDISFRFVLFAKNRFDQLAHPRRYELGAESS